MWSNRLFFKVIFAFLYDFILNLNILRLNIEALALWPPGNGLYSCVKEAGNAREKPCPRLFVLSLSPYVPSQGPTVLYKTDTSSLSLSKVRGISKSSYAIGSLASPDLLLLRGWAELGWEVTVSTLRCTWYGQLSKRKLVEVAGNWPGLLIYAHHYLTSCIHRTLITVLWGRNHDCPLIDDKTEARADSFVPNHRVCGADSQICLPPDVSFMPFASPHHPDH